MMDNQQLWQATLGELELTLSRANFMTLFKNTFITSADGERVIVGVPNTFTKAWFEKKYHTFILRALQKVSENRVREVIYKVEVGPRVGATISIQQVETVTPPAPAASNDEGSVTSELGLNTRYTFENFVIGKANELAHAACLAVSNKPGRVYNPLFLYGGVGLGKTHLLQAVGNYMARPGGLKVLYVSSEKFVNDFIHSISSNFTNRFKNVYRTVDVLLVDDVQFLAGKEGTQEEFFHTFNALHQNNKQIILIS